MRALLRPGEVCHFATAAREIAFDSPMLLVGAPAAGNAGIGDLTTKHMNALFDRPIPRGLWWRARHCWKLFGQRWMTYHLDDNLDGIDVLSELFDCGAT